VKEEVKMEAGLIIGNQIIIMFIILIIGAFCYLKGIITKDGTKQLSSFALNIINPVLIFMSYQSKYDKSLVHGLLWSFLLSAISYAVTILLTYVLIRKKTPDLAVERVSSIYSNCAFMCIPLINGIYVSRISTPIVVYATRQGFQHADSVPERMRELARVRQSPWVEHNQKQQVRLRRKDRYGRSNQIYQEEAAPISPDWSTAHSGNV
jgi:hypothetical protein